MEGLSEIQQFVMGVRQRPTQSPSGQGAHVPHYPHPSQLIGNPSHFTTLQQYHYHQHQPLLRGHQTPSQPTLSQSDELLAHHRNRLPFLLSSSLHPAESPSPPFHITNQQPHRLAISPPDQSLVRTPPSPRYYYSQNANSHFPMASCLPAIPPSNPTVSSQLNIPAAQFMDQVAADSQWTAQETVALLQIKSNLQAHNKDLAGNANLCGQISRKLSELGFNRSMQECKEKLENVEAGRGVACAKVSGQLEVMLHAEAASNNKGDSKMSTLRDNSDNDDNNNNNSNNNFTSGGETQDSGNNSAGRDINSSASGGSSDYVDETRIEESEERIEFKHSLLYKQVAGLGTEEGEVERLSSMRKRKMNKQVLGGSNGGEKEEEKLLERLAKQVMKQQEALHHKFLERLEKRDEERAIREEARKREEASRTNREHEARAQEYALAAKRDAALLAFLHKLNGQISVHPGTSNSNVCPTTDLFYLQQQQQPAIINTNEEENEKEHSDRRWPKVEVHGLIRVRSGMEPRFQEAGPKAQLWEEISNSMACMGFQRSAKRCKEKWENINKYYRKTKDSCRKRPENAKTCPYFHQLEMLYNKGILHSPSPTTTKAHNEKQQQEFLNEEVQQLLLTDNSTGRPSTNGGDSTSSLTTTNNNNNNNNNNNGGGESMACIRMEGLVKDILHMQQEQQRRLVNEYQRMEQMPDHGEEEGSSFSFSLHKKARQ